MGLFLPNLASDGAVFESGFGEFLGVVDIATVDDEGVLHGLFHHAEARHAELFPFGDEQQSVCVEQGFVHVAAINDLLRDGLFRSARNDVARVRGIPCGVHCVSVPARAHITKNANVPPYLMQKKKTGD